MAIEWNTLLLEQLTWHWENHLRPRLDGLTDDEYFWEPAAGCWSVRPSGAGFVMDLARPEPDPVPFTTIAWRLAHLSTSVLGERNAKHFGGPARIAPAATAKDAVRQLDEGYATWVAGVRALGEDGLDRPCGPAEGPFAAFPLAALVLHIHREVLHHGAEVLVLRDLYRTTER